MSNTLTAMKDKYSLAAINRCNIVQSRGDGWEKELQIRLDKLIERNYQGDPQRLYDEAEIHEIKKRLLQQNI